MEVDEAVSATEALPIYVVGDSHALPYQNMIFRDHRTERWIVVHSKYISGLTAHDFFARETDEFHSEFIRFLEYEGLVRDARATHLSQSEIDLSISKAAQQPATSPLILICVGDIDLRGAIMPMLADTHDFIPPFETTIAALDRPLVPWALIDEAISNRIAPLEAGLKRLNECGFNRIYVQAVVPPTRNEARIGQLHGFTCPVSVRTKLVQAFNRTLGNACTSANAVFLDLWPQFTDCDYLRPELEVDGVHLPPQRSQQIARAMLEHAINCQWLAVNHVRYDLYYQMACGRSPFA